MAALTRSIGSAVVRLRAIRERVGEDRLRILGQIALAAWFAAQTFMRIAMFVHDKVPIGQDVEIYYRASRNGSRAAIRGRLRWSSP